MYTRKQNIMFNFWTVAVALFLLVSASTSGAQTDLLSTHSENDETASSSLLLDVVNTGQRLVSVGERGYIIYSDDNGNHWNQAQVPTSVTLTSVYFPTFERGWAVGHDGIVLHTEDAGKTWKKQLDGYTGHKLSLRHAEKLLSEKMTQRAANHPEPDEKTEEMIEELQLRINDIKHIIENDMWGDPLMDVWFKDELEGFVLGSYGLVYHTSDGGLSWEPWWDKIENPYGLHYYSITEANRVLLIAGESGSLYRSTDGGQYWQQLVAPTSGSYFGAVSCDNLFFVFGLGGTIAYSNDSGNHWNLIETEAAGTISCAAFKDPHTLVVASYSGEITVISLVNFVSQTSRVGLAWSGVAVTSDGNIILAGLYGVKLVRFNEIK